MQVSVEKYVTISAIRPLHHLTENALKVEGSDSLAVAGPPQSIVFCGVEY